MNIIGQKINFPIEEITNLKHIPLNILMLIKLHAYSY